MGTAKRIAFSYSDEDGEEVEADLPAKNEVCSRCDGEGHHVNPNVDGNGLTAEDFEEDPDFAEDYRSGVYDVTCEECGGRNVVLEVDRATAERECPELLKRYDDQLRCNAECDREMAAERRMGA